MVTTNYIQLINYLNEFAQIHKEVKRFDSDFDEQMNNYATSDKAYPLLYASPQPSYFLDDDMWSNYTIKITCLDILQKDRTNVKTILNTCSLILNDLNTYFKEYNVEGVFVEGISDINPVNNYLVDYDAGWEMTVNFQMANNNECELPIDGNITPSSACLPAEITLDGAAFLSVISGGNADINLVDENDDPLTPISVIGTQIKIDTACDDATITLNSSPFFDASAGTTENITLVDQDDLPITPISTIGTEIKVNVGGVDPFANGFVLGRSFSGLIKVNGLDAKGYDTNFGNSLDVPTVIYPEALYYDSVNDIVVAFDNNMDPYYSTDKTETWNVGTLDIDTNRVQRAIAYDGSLYVTSADHYSVSPYYYTSPDAINWTRRTLAISGRDITYGNGTFVVVGSGASNVGQIRTSSDGLTWTIRTVPFSGGSANTIIYSVTYSSSLDVFVAARDCSGPNKGLIYSTNGGVTWNEATGTNTSNMFLAEVKWIDSLNIFVAFGRIDGSPFTSKLYTSTDGITWSEPITLNISDNFSNIVYNSSDNKVYVYVGSRYAITSDDGINWDYVPSVGIYSTADNNLVWID